MTSNPPPERPQEVFLEGVRLNTLDEDECVRFVMHSLSLGRGGWIVTPNLDHLRRLSRDESLRARYGRANLALADGMPLVWACRLQGTPLPGRVAGSDLIWSLSRAAADRELALFLVGGDPGTAEDTARELLSRFEGLRVVGTLCPKPGFEQGERGVAEIRERLSSTRPDLIFVALGSPKQEILIDNLRSTLPSAWWLGVGISFSFVAGRVKRAPSWLRSLGFEWLHRMGQDPSRLAGRYLVDDLPFGMGLIARSAFRGLCSASTRNGA